VSAAADQPRTRDALRAAAPLLIALGSGPAAWALQLIASYGLASWACYPHDAPHRRVPLPGWGAEPAILTTINLVCLGLDAVGLAVCVLALRRAAQGEEALNIRVGWTRFLAACGALACAGFGAAILVSAVCVFMVPACWNIPP